MFKNIHLLLLLIITNIINAQPAAVQINQVADGLSSGVGLTNASDGSGRLFAIQQSGEIIIWDGSDFLATPFLDISTVVSTGGERGLLGIAFHPNYQTNGFFYLNYTDSLGDTVIARYSVSADDPNLADTGSALQILSFDQPSANHNGGDIHFASDGYLYIATGDGGANSSTAQDIDSLLGKILRVDVNNDDFPSDASKNYAIPASNPFVGAVPGADEVWLMGLRNPWRFSFDRLNDDIIIGDVGEGTWEEVNYLTAASGGENFGWPCYEGDDVFNSSGCGSIGNYVFPVHSLPHGAPPNNNLSVIGGYRFRDAAYPRLNGWYFFTDWGTGILWAADPDSGATWSAFNVGEMGTFFITGFSEGENGELYVVSNWKILQIVDPIIDVVFVDDFE
jgi:hypothetical protein